MQDAPKIKQFSGRSLLRYPGGKTRAIECITRYFPKPLTGMISPFLGGGSIELFIAAQSIQVFGFDVFSPLAEFWQCVTENADALANKVSKYYPLSKEKFYALQNNLTCFNTKMERAAVYYVLNRSSFSGATLSGGMSPLHPRFTQTSVERLRNFYNPFIKVEQADFKQSLEADKKNFAYLDPPYLIKSSLYGRKGNAHKDFEHGALASILKNRTSWILSYNDCEEIRKLYKNFKIIAPNWKYGMGNNKSSNEILIFSDDLNAD